MPVAETSTVKALYRYANICMYIFMIRSIHPYIKFHLSSHFLLLSQCTGKQTGDDTSAS